MFQSISAVFQTLNHKTNKPLLCISLNIIWSSSGYTTAEIVQDTSGYYLSSGYTCTYPAVYSVCSGGCIDYVYCDAPGITPTPTHTATPTQTPTPTITPTFTATVTFYGVMGDLSSSFGILYYSTDNSTWNPIAASFSYTCGVIDVITVDVGDTVYVSIGDPSLQAYYYNAQVGTSCPSNSATYCGSGSKFSTVVSGNTDIAITQYVTGGDILAC